MRPPNIEVHPELKDSRAHGVDGKLPEPIGRVLGYQMVSEPMNNAEELQCPTSFQGIKPHPCFYQIEVDLGLGNRRITLTDRVQGYIQNQSHCTRLLEENWAAWQKQKLEN